MASKHMGTQRRKITGGTASTVFHRGREIGRVSLSGKSKLGSHVALKRTSYGYKHLGFHNSAKAAHDHVVRAAFRPPGGKVPKLKRPGSIFRKRTHPTQSLGV